jgi:hypothetical protein
VNPADAFGLTTEEYGAFVDDLAAALASRLGDARHGPSRLVDAATVAEHFGMTRGAVYGRADEFGAVRIGGGPRPRLRFDLAEVRQRLEATAERTRETQPRRAPSRRRTHNTAGGRATQLLPVTGRRV